MEIELFSQKYSYDIEYKSIRTIRLRLTSQNTFIISCPRLTPKFFITKFITEHQQWIVKNSSRYRQKPILSNLTNLRLLGQKYELIITKTASDSLIIFDESQKIHLNVTSFSDSHLKAILNKKLRPLALKLIKRELVILSEKFTFNYHKVTVRNQSSRFGSCSSRGNLSFNWQIILLPLGVFRHVLLHELTHLDIKDHSRKFWDQLKAYDPDTPTHNRFLKSEATKLFLV